MGEVRAAIYARQSVGDEDGIERQLEWGRAEAERRGWVVIEPPYVDNNVSATKRRSAGTAWARMLADIDAGQVQAVVATKLDRLLRDIRELIQLLDRDAFVVTSDLDLASDMGKLQATMLTGVARFEVERKAARSMASAAMRHAQGHPMPGRVPFGYVWVPKPNRDARGTRWAVVPEEAELVRFMFREALAAKDGEIIAPICRKLNEDGYLTRQGTRWRSSTVRRTLLSPFYAGLLPERQGDGYRAELVDMDKCRRGLWEPLVTADELRAVRGRLMDPSRRKHDGNTRRKWLLSGIARCSVCSGPIRPATVNAPSKPRGYRCVVGHFQRRAEMIDRAVEEAVIERLSRPDAVSLIQPPPGVDVPALRAREGSLVAQIQEAGLLVRQGWTAAQVGDLAAPMRAELERVQAELSSLHTVDPLAEVVSSVDVRATWEGLTMARRRRIVEALAVVMIHPVGKGVRVDTLEQAASTVTLRWWHAETAKVRGGILRVKTSDRLDPAARERVSRALR